MRLRRPTKAFGRIGPSFWTVPTGPPPFGARSPGAEAWSFRSTLADSYAPAEGSWFSYAVESPGYIDAGHYAFLLDDCRVAAVEYDPSNKHISPMGAGKS